MIRLLHKISHIKTVGNNLLNDRNSTHCHWLLDSVFIDPHGDVYTCCHKEPGRLGNIYENDLAGIWEHGRRLKIFRLLASYKCLHCFFECNIISKKENLTGNQVPAPYPRRIWIEFGESCNLNCIMCVQDHRSKTILDKEILKNQINWTNQIEEIEFQGGEILTMKSAKEMYIWLTRQMNKKVNIITNGLLINDEWAGYLVDGSNWIQISVNAATKETHERVNRNSEFIKVIDNIGKLIHMKRQSRSEVRIIYKYTITLENIHEIADAIEFADRLGCDEIAFGYDRQVEPVLRENKKQSEKIKDDVSKVMDKNLRIKIEKNRLVQLGIL